MKRSNRPIYAGMIFILAAVIIAAAIYFGLRAGSPRANESGDAAPNVTVQGRDAPASAATATSREWLIGNWVMVPKGGEDGGTQCSDFTNRHIYALNRRTAKIMTFYPNGAYRDMFVYTIPTGEEHMTATTARWQLSSDKVTFEDAVMQDAFTVPSDGPYSLGIKRDGNHCAGRPSLRISLCTMQRLG